MIKISLADNIVKLKAQYAPKMYDAPTGSECDLNAFDRRVIAFQTSVNYFISSAICAKRDRKRDTVFAASDVLFFRSCKRMRRSDNNTRPLFRIADFVSIQLVTSANFMHDSLNASKYSRVVRHLQVVHFSSSCVFFFFFLFFFFVARWRQTSAKSRNEENKRPCAAPSVRKVVGFGADVVRFVRLVDRSRRRRQTMNQRLRRRDEDEGSSRCLPSGGA